MSPTKQLYELQQMEEGFAHARQALGVVEKELGDTRLLDQARARAEALRSTSEKLLHEQRDLELRIAGLEERLVGVDQKLYGGGTTNPKELQSLQDDARMLQRQKGEQEDRLLELMLRGEGVQKDLTAAEEALRSAEATWAAEQERLGREQERLKQETVRLEQGQKEAAARLTSQELSLYQSLKASRGQAVSKVGRGICQACGLSLPSHEMQRARAGQELVRCGSCGRLLYAS